MPNKQVAIYVKEAAGYPGEENSEELQTRECEAYCEAQGWTLHPGTATGREAGTTSSG